MVTDHFHEGKMDVRLGASGARKTEAEKKIRGQHISI